MYVLILMFCMTTISLTNTDVPSDSIGAKFLQLNHYTKILHDMQDIQSLKLKKAGVNDLVIGETDPDEVKIITGYYRLDGDLIILNNGVLHLQNADFYMNGDINITGNGQLFVEGEKFTVVQEYIYEHQAIIIMNGSLKIHGVDISSSGQSWSIGMVGKSYYELSLLW